MTQTVILTARAERDIDTILVWLFNRSPAGARSWHTALEKALHWLRDNASSCAKAPESRSSAEEIREHFFKTHRGRRYRLLFTVTGNEVQVLHVRGPGQDLVGRDS
jgi:plasmid stabilization system protein ParE